MTAFDWGSYYSLKSQAFAKLQELYEIDQILDGMKAAGYDDKPSDFWSDNGSNDLITFNLGRTHPFTLEAYKYEDPGLVDNPLTEDEKVDYSFVESASGDAADWIAGRISYFDDTVEPLLKVDSEEFSRLARLLLRPLAALERVERNFAYLESGDWEGRAADRFFLNFYDTLAELRENHIWGIDHLLVLIAHLKSCNDAGQVSLMNLLEAVDAAADEQLAYRAAKTTDQASDQSGYAVAAGGATVLAGLTVGAPPVAAAFTVLAGVFSVMSAIPERVASAIPFRGIRAEDLEGALAQAFRDTVEDTNSNFLHTYDLAGQIDTSVATLQEHVRGTPRGYDKWEPIQPGLEPGNDRGFHHDSSGRAS